MKNYNFQQVGSISLAEGKKAYFASDVHLGLYPYDKSREREQRFVSWMDSIKKDAGALFLVGDIFDYWYEYKKVTARGYVRFLGKLCEITDNNIPVYFFTGNHDVWVFDYLPSETGVKVFKNPIEIIINKTKFFIAHGDGLGPGDYGYKILRRIFHNKILQYIFSKIHPDITYALGNSWSRHSRYSKGLITPFLGLDKEYNILFAREYLKTNDNIFFIFGHRHIPMNITLSGNSRLINLGEWINACTYAEFDGENLSLKSFVSEDVNIIRN